MRPGRRAIDKIYKRRDRYDIPDWQRRKVWLRGRKQALIDSILRGWRLPKFYFLKQGEDEFEVVDGQQRLNAIFEFFDNELPLSAETERNFGGRYYRDLPSRLSDQFDDFEIDYDVIEDAEPEELRDFFRRLQRGLGLTSSEKLNSERSKLRDFCRQLTDSPFFKKKISVGNRRYGHFDVAAKVAALEIEGLDSGLRYEDLREVFVHQVSFSSRVAELVAKLNASYAAQHGEDLFKMTNKVSEGLRRLGRTVRDLTSYGELIDDLYFLLHEGPGSRLRERPQSFEDVRVLRTALRHDVDHGPPSDVRKKRRQAGAVFQELAGSGTPDTLPSERFPLVQAVLLARVERDLRRLLHTTEPGFKQ